MAEDTNQKEFPHAQIETGDTSEPSNIWEYLVERYGPDAWGRTVDSFNKTVDTATSITADNWLSGGINTASSAITTLKTGAENAVDNTLMTINDGVAWLQGNLGDVGDLVALPLTVLSQAGSAYRSIATGYNDGVTETDFGSQQEASWRKLVNHIKGPSSRINILKSTPLNSQSDRRNLYGNMLLGVPYLMPTTTDPNNRAMMETFIKDSRFLSLTPGRPKFNGSRYTRMTASQNSLRQTSTADEMIAYLAQNGVNQSNLTKDKRYYSFEPQYGPFYSYLETFLNMVWVKLGLATTTGDQFNLYSFFATSNEELGKASSDSAEPLNQYKSAIGIFVNPTGSITENITNERTSYGSELASETNNRSDEFRRLNFLTGMGNGSTLDLVRNISGRAMLVTDGVKELLGQTFSNTISGVLSGSGVAGKIWGAVKGVAKDTLSLMTRSDYGNTIQAYTTTNGMQVRYPELWSDGSYTKSMNFQFNFTSPYGDPLSIFKYVYVPFGVLLAFTLQRQADDNGFVSPFFIRADMPGYFTCDLGFISNMSFTRGGPQGLFTKDGLPRSISGDFTIEDLFPYLAMSRRVSFLSANPAYTSFVDSMVGLRTTYSNSSSTLDQYWDAMLNRVNGQSSGTSLWNSFNKIGRVAHSDFGNGVYSTNTRFNSSTTRDSTWYRKVSD